MRNEQICCICEHLHSAEIIDADNIYTCPSCENMSCKTIVKKGANCTTNIDGGNIEEYLHKEKLLAAAGGTKSLLKQCQYLISLKGDEIVKIILA